MAFDFNFIIKNVVHPLSSPEDRWKFQGMFSNRNRLSYCAPGEAVRYVKIDMPMSILVDFNPNNHLIHREILIMNFLLQKLTSGFRTNDCSHHTTFCHFLRPLIDVWQTHTTSTSYTKFLHGRFVAKTILWWTKINFKKIFSESLLIIFLNSLEKSPCSLPALLSLVHWRRPWNGVTNNILNIARTPKL